MDKATPAWPSTLTRLSGRRPFNRWEDAVRGQVRVLIELLPEADFDSGQHERGPASAGRRYGHGHRRRAGLRIAGDRIVSVNARRVRPALQSLFGGCISNDALSWASHKTHASWEMWPQRVLPDRAIVWLILGATALASSCDDLVQRCTMHEECNRLSCVPEHLHDETRAGFNDLMCAKSAADDLAKRPAFLARCKLCCRPVAASLKCAETAAKLLWALLAFSQVPMRRVDCCRTAERSSTVLYLTASP